MSPAVSGSRVSKKTRFPSRDTAANEASNAPLPPAGPVDTRLVVPPAYSYTSRHWGPWPAAQPVSVSAATRDSSVRT